MPGGAAGGPPGAPDAGGAPGGPGGAPDPSMLMAAMAASKQGKKKHKGKKKGKGRRGKKR
jgi:hypothetical protein